MLKEVKNFIIHLRLHYQFFVLSGAFLIGAILAEPKSVSLFITQFFSVHILFFGGVTAYNSYYDKDEGPIGGLKNPPKMKHWMLIASWVFQVLGLLIATLAGRDFVLVYLLSMFFFWIYSSPITRWKGKPLLSMLAMGIATGLGAFLMGYFSFGGAHLSINLLLLACGTTLCFLAVYPASQAYQIQEDRRRGDITFAVRYGKDGISKLFLILFPLGTIINAWILYSFNFIVFRVYIIGAIFIGLFIWRTISSIKLNKTSYDTIMRLKYFSGMTLSTFSIVILILKIYDYL